MSTVGRREKEEEETVSLEICLDMCAKILSPLKLCLLCIVSSYLVQDYRNLG